MIYIFTLWSTFSFVLSHRLLPFPVSLLINFDHTPCFCFLTSTHALVQLLPSPHPEVTCHGGLQWLSSLVPFSFSLHDLSHYPSCLPGPFPCLILWSVFLRNVLKKLGLSGIQVMVLLCLYRTHETHCTTSVLVILSTLSSALLYLNTRQVFWVDA